MSPRRRVSASNAPIGQRTSITHGRTTPQYLSLYKHTINALFDALLIDYWEVFWQDMSAGPRDNVVHAF
jgi:hypothetical protein